MLPPLALHIACRDPAPARVLPAQLLDNPLRDLENRVRRAAHDYPNEREPEDAKLPVVEREELAHILDDDFEAELGRARDALAESIGDVRELRGCQGRLEEQLKAELEP